MKERTEEEGKPVVSTFDNLDSAERAVNAALSRPSAREKINSMIEKGKRSVEIEEDLGYNVGGFLKRGEETSKETTRVRIILQNKGNIKDAYGKTYVVRTAFPAPPK